ncbi:MAG: phosphoglycolate phosphatase [Piscirickettsiaceae bacterium]|nr:phosphoglycolate phosphatase [Piscirickettsiaceae bacterium]
MKLDNIKMVLIDLDGTMVNSVPDLAWCIDEMMKELDMPAHGEEKVKNWVGNGVPRLIKRALIGQLYGEPDDPIFAKAYPIFMNLYADNHSKRSLLYPHIMEGLQWLRDRNMHIGCVTNKDEQFTLPILKNLNIYNYFQIIISGDTLPSRKPNPAPLLHGAAFFGIAPKNAMMIGDSISDIKASRAAGFDIICLSYGYNHGIDISTANPDAVINSFAEF